VRGGGGAMRGGGGINMRASYEFVKYKAKTGPSVGEPQVSASIALWSDEIRASFRL